MLNFLKRWYRSAGYGSLFKWSRITGAALAFRYRPSSSVLLVTWVNFWRVRGPPQFHTPSVQHISFTQKGRSFSAPKLPQFHTENPLLQHRKPLSSTYPSVSHQKTLSSTYLSVPHQKPVSSTHLFVLN